MKRLSNAKINVGLKIVGKKDGYHLLESTFVPISLFDEIEIQPSEKDAIEGMNINIEDNIMYKALCLMRERYNIKECYKIKINKKIPMEAGLGGGSGNAASIIKMLNEMNNLKLSNEEMACVGLSLGSDIPFFIYNCPSIGEGKGEIIKPIENYEKIYGILIFDDMHFSTKEVYDTYDVLENKDDVLNDLELAARILSKGDRIELIEIDLTNHGAYLASLTGSGGGIFGLFKDNDKMLVALEALKDKYSFVEVFESLS